jgi:uncharacterized protein YndB with AHSA1/START domain
MRLDHNASHDPERDLILTRVVAAPRARLWAAWTEPDLLKKWFCPAPWSVSDCEIDLRPGGIFRTTMRSPEGLEFPGVGCYLEIIPQERLVWTDALGPGYRPSDEPFMTGIIAFRDVDGGTEYTARAIHRDPATRIRHEEMGFHNGWSTALDQLVALISRG